MTARKDGKPKRPKVVKGRRMPKDIVELRAWHTQWTVRAYNAGYRDAMKLVKQLADDQLRETK